MKTVLVVKVNPDGTITRWNEPASEPHVRGGDDERDQLKAEDRKLREPIRPYWEE